MKAKTEATPRPWKRVQDAQGDMGFMHPTKPGVAVAWFSSAFLPTLGFVGDEEYELGRPERQANIDLIDRAVNAHDALVRALQEARAWIPRGDRSKSPADRGAKCETAYETLAMIAEALRAAGVEE